VFLGAFEKLRKSLLRHVWLSFRMEYLGSHWTDFAWNFIFDDFSKICWEKNQISLKYGKKNGYFT